MTWLSYGLLVAQSGLLRPSGMFSSKPSWICCLQKHTGKCTSYVFLLFHWENISIVWKGQWISMLVKVDQYQHSSSSVLCFSLLCSHIPLFPPLFFHFAPLIHFLFLYLFPCCKRVTCKINVTNNYQINLLCNNTLQIIFL